MAPIISRLSSLGGGGTGGPTFGKRKLPASGLTLGQYGPFDFFGDGSALAHWKLDGNANDVSGNYNGTASNVSYVTGLFDQAGDFNGSNSTISTSTVKNSYPFSVSLWATSDVLWDTSSYGMRELFNLSIGGQRVSLGITRYDAGSWPVGVAIMYGGTSHYTASSTSSIFVGSTTSTWYHIVFSVVGNTNASHRVYVNGCQLGLKDNGGGHGGSAGWNIGSNSAGGEYWDGKIDNVRFFNKAISSSEAWSLYQEYQTVSTVVQQNLKLWYDFSNASCYSGSGSTVNNLATGQSSNFVGTVTGATFGGSGNAKYFDFERDSGNNRITTSTTIQNVLNTKCLTLEIWAYHESIGGGDGIGGLISSQYDGGNGGGQTGASINTDSRSSHGGGPNGYHFQMAINSAWTTTGSSGNTASGTGDVSNRWDHIVAVFDGKNKYVYENGSLLTDMGDFSLALNDNITYNNTTWTIGCQPQGGSFQRFYDGKIAIARIYDIGLSPAQILHNYNTEKSRFGL
jgi:hypothetical protein